MRWHQAGPGETVLSGLLLVVLALLVIYPLVSLIYGSIRSSPPGTGEATYTVEHFLRIFADPHFYEAWRNTLLLSAGATLVALVFGLPVTFLIARTDMPYRSLAQVLVIIPLFISPFIGAVAWTGLGAPRVGMLNRWLEFLGVPWEVNIYGVWGMALVLGFYMIPFVYLFTSGPMKAIDASLEEASRLSGRNALQTTLQITLPLITPSILACALLVMVLSMENFGVPAVLALPSRIPLVPTEIFVRFSYPPADYGYATVVALSLIAVTGVGLLLQRRIIKTASYAAISGRGYRVEPILLGRWKWVAVAILGAYMVATILLPYGVMILASFQAYWTQEFTAFTLDNYRSVYTRGLLVRATENSLLLAVFGACVATALAACIAYVVQRSRAPGRSWLDFMATIPIGVPGMVLGVALLWAWIAIPLEIYGTIWILLIAYVTRFLPFGVRNVSAALTQVGDELESAARVSGATQWRTAVTITLPLVRNNVLSSWVIYFIEFLKELNMSVLLYSFGSVVIPVVIFDLYTEGRYPEVAALAVGLSVLILAALAIFSRFFRIRVSPLG